MGQNSAGGRCRLSRNAGDSRDTESNSEQRPEQRQRTDLSGRSEECLPARGAALPQPPPLIRQPPPHADGNNDREPEQQRTGLASDEHEPLRRDASARSRVEQRLIRPAQPEYVAGARQVPLRTRLVGQHAGDLPDVELGRIDRRDPAIGAEDAVERRQRVEGVPTVCEQQDGRVAADAGRAERAAEDRAPGQIGGAHADEVDVTFIESLPVAGADLEHLAARGSTAPWQPAGAKANESGDAVEADELRELAIDAELAEERRAQRTRRRKRVERGGRLPVGDGVCLAGGKAKRVDAEAPVARGERAQRAHDGSIPRDETAARHAEQHRGCRGDAERDEQRATAMRAQPCRGDSEWRTGAAHSPSALRRRYARVFVRFPQSCIEHQVPERFFEGS